jgi:hypothetical protein
MIIKLYQRRNDKFLTRIFYYCFKRNWPRKEKIFRYAAIYDINSKFKQGGFGEFDLIMMPHGKRLKGQPVDFNYRINPKYLDIFTYNYLKQILIFLSGSEFQELL